MEVTQVGEQVVNYFNECVTKKNPPQDDDIEQCIAKIMHDYILFKNEHSDSDSSDDGKLEPKKKSWRTSLSEYDEIPSKPDGNYKWTERVNMLDLTEILE